MNKRLIGGTLYAIVLYGALLSGSELFQWLLVAFLIIGIYEIISIFIKSPKKVYSSLYTLIFSLGILLLIQISKLGVEYILYLSLTVAFTDVFSYWTGKLFGRNKLTKISPNKTIEGSIGGLILGPIFAIILVIFLDIIFNSDFLFLKTSEITILADHSLLYIWLAGVLLSGAGQIGDLAESLLKRNANVKDSGTIVYGHGGILDRIDSIVFSALIWFILF